MRSCALLVYYCLGAKLPDLAFPGGRLYNRIRCCALTYALAQFGDHNEVDGGIYVGDGSDVHIGSRCQINSGCRLTRVVIGNSVMIGPDVVVIGKLHATDDLTVPMVEQGSFERRPTEIEDDVWIGARAILMPGVRVGTGAIVGAGAVVTRDVDERTVVGGVPARFLKRRETTVDQLGDR